MKKTLLYIFSLLTLSLSAQDIKFDVLSNGGGRISNVNSTSFTFGQPIVGTITNGGNSIRQGFQQPSFRMGVPGCTDSLALNFNPLATVDDSTCYYCSINVNAFPIIFPSSPTACDGAIILTPTSGTSPYTYNWSNSNTTAFNTSLCNGVYAYLVTDVNGCGFNDTIILTNYVGCTDSTAINYNPTAIVDDGSCIAFVYGCTDSTAINYNPLANTDDGSCIPYVYGCIDSTATNYDSNANTDDGSCTYCYATANIGSDTITACDSVLISTNTIINGTYVWNTSNVSTTSNLAIGDTYQVL